jgi:hypothetical protein
MRRRWVVEQPASGDQCGLNTHRWQQCPDHLGQALVLRSSRACRGCRVATSTSGSSRLGAGCDLSLSLLHLARWVRGIRYGVYVHHVGEAGTPRTIKAPLPGTPNVEMVLRHFHRHCYKSSPLWFFIREGLSL